MDMLDIALKCSIIVDTMQKRPKHHTEAPVEQTASELWRAWEHRAVVLTQQDCVDRGLKRKTDVYEWLYTLGIQPDAYIIRKADRRTPGYLEIRFASDADIAYIKMAGL